VANIIGDIYKHRGEAIRWMPINYELSVKSNIASLSAASGYTFPPILFQSRFE
jgi:hypothetical protein